MVVLCRRPTATASNRTATTTTTNGNLRLSSPNSSEGNSTWSASLLEDTTTTLNDLNANHTKKNIDNDNRSDGQSSNMGNYGWYSSDDSDSSSNSSDDDDDDDDDDDENESKKSEENEVEILRHQCDLGHQQVQEQHRGHDKVDSSRFYIAWMNHIRLMDNRKRTVICARQYYLVSRPTTIAGATYKKLNYSMFLFDDLIHR